MVLFPESFKKRMQEKLGAEWAAFEHAHETPSPVSVRVNPAKRFSGENLTGSIPWTEHGFYLQQRPVFTLDPLLHAGCYYVQEASSMFLEQAFKQHVSGRRLRVLDLCAAPGGKSTHILSLLDEASLLITNEVIRSRVYILSENIQKWGHHNVVVTNNDPADFSQLQGFFDVIVVDAPCSGEGLFRKDPDAMTEWSEENVSVCAQRQRRIVEDVWPALKENGLLIYSTCTYNEKEDEETLRWIDSKYKAEFLPLDTKEWNIEEVKDGRAVGYRFYPHKEKGEGFFLSVIQKCEAEPGMTIKPPKSPFAIPEKRIREEIRMWLQNPEGKLIQRDELIQLLPADHAETIHFLTQRLRIIYAGTFIATAKHTKLVPEHAFALSTQLNSEPFIKTVLTEREALQYLRRDTLNIQTEKKGFSLATYNGIPIGWMNLLAGRINNLYPQEWRIRMEIPAGN
jgi:16S rRNA C967 or C1407 C5-methylase (RsmB/RsmF family)/NOL1/NOP2/fmu family ribosome biogenesis protein